VNTLMRIGWHVDDKRSGPVCNVLEPRAGHVARLAREPREPCPDCQSSTREHGICDCWTAEEMRQAYAVDDNSSSRDKKI
jgi:hypothetical protein